MLQVDLEAASSRAEFLVIGDVSSDDRCWIEAGMFCGSEGTSCCSFVYTGLL